MSNVDINDFSCEIECIYKEEKYSVRDNGAVLRHPHKRKLKRKHPRPTDNQWTFGKVNPKNGYLGIASVRVHRIVATAFHGNPPSKYHVVDHIDTNQQNNRPENLRWLTRWENITKNPITLNRIEFVYGSIETFFERLKLHHRNPHHGNFEWMRPVTLQEAQACKENLLLWFQSNKKPSGGSFRETIFQLISNSPQKEQIIPTSHKDNLNKPINPLIKSKTPGAMQLNSKLPSEYPCQPNTPIKNPIKKYAAQLKIGSIFAQDDFKKSEVLKTAVSQDSKKLWVMCELPIKPKKYWSITEITYKDSQYIYETQTPFITEEDAEKEFYIIQGLKWNKKNSNNDQHANQKSNPSQKKEATPTINDHYLAHGLIMSKTPRAAQEVSTWRTPAEFPCCPSTPNKNPIKEYADQLKIGSIFAQDDFKKSEVLKTAVSQDNKKLWVMCGIIDSTVNPLSLAEVRYERSLYIHKSLGRFITEEGAEKHFCIIQGLEWTGGDTFDDYC